LTVGFGTTLGSLELAVMVITWVLSLLGPGLIPVSMIVCPVFGPTTTSLSGSTVGGSFTATTVIVKKLVIESMPPLPVPPLSFTTTAMVAVPN